MTGSGKEIPYFTFDSGRAGPRVLISAGVHGDEYEPMLAAAELIKLLPEKLVAGQVTIVPVVNTSAWSAGTRCGTDGLDLARICPGKERGTASEAAAAKISGFIRQASHYIDLHTGGRALEIYPLAGYMLHDHPNVLEQQRKMAQAFNLPLIWGTESAPEGRTLSVARDARVPAIYVEYGGGNRVRPEVVSACRQGCLNILAMLKMVKSREAMEAAETMKKSAWSSPPAASRPPAGSPPPVASRPPAGSPPPVASPASHPPRYWVEDPRPGGGHLQAKMPAPCDGIFVPAIEPGTTVKQGQLWGHIVRPPAGEQQEIRADQEGMVLFVRADARVSRGDSLGGILPVNESNLNALL